jgi:AcrR family transcriptional regulator
LTEQIPVSIDRRIQKTRYALRNALISLLPEYGWDDLSVQDICARANVGRSTFYMHFQSKDELLVGGLNDLRSALCMQVNEAKKTDPGRLLFVRGLIEHVHDQRKLFNALIGRRSGHVVQLRFREMVLQMTQEDTFGLTPDRWQCNATAHFIAGALVDLLAWWVDAGCAQSIQEIELLVHELTAPSIAKLGIP